MVASTTSYPLSNCYSYALNRPDLGKLELGESFQNPTPINIPLKSTTEEYFNALAVSDGLIPIAEEDIDPNTNHTMAIVGHTLEEGHLLDFHLFRVDKDKKVSHFFPHKTKPSSSELQKGTPLTTKNLLGEYSKYAATNPNIDYAVFAGFYQVPDKGLILQTP